MEIAAVALPLPIEQSYSYGVPPELRGIVRIGSAVLVPFGRQTLTGIVIDEGESMEGEGRSLKPITDILDAEPAITGDQITLARWISEYYLCSMGEVLRAALPPGLTSSSKLRLERNSPVPGPDPGAPLTEMEQTILSTLPETGSVSIRSFLRELPAVTRQQLRKLESRGLLSKKLVVSGPRARARKLIHVHLCDAAPTDEPRGKLQLLVVEALREAAQEDAEAHIGAIGMARETLIKQTGASTTTIKRLQEMGFVRLSEKEIDRSRSTVAALAAVKPPPHHELNPDQVGAIERITEAIEGDRFETFLLHGVTGSGKTEVYIEALKTARKRGKSGIVLVPEIALTPQTVARFRSHFGEEIAVMHSRMSPGERFDAWRGIRAGTYSIVIGPRSAVLAPVGNLGLIVVDEEHEQSYKQFDPAPRYHARDVAVMRASQNAAVCVLGSATPSLESITNARNGKYSLLSLPQRIVVDGQRARLPAVRIVDMRTKSIPGESFHILSRPLVEAIALRLAAEEQIILLQNRRGYAPIIRCEQCNWAPDCPDCSVTMTYHKSHRHLRCHYCGKTRRLPPSCPECGYDSVLQLGVGTQRVEEEILAHFPEARVARMDLDTTSTRNAHHRILDRFARREADILLGTQMVAKGLDFANVSLVGIIDADTGMHLPDIRAEERTFQLLTQVAGRAGRADIPGEVILQTKNPGHRVIQYATQHDYHRFVDNILPERAALDYPPYGRIVAVLVTGPDEAVVSRLARDWCRTALQIDSTLTLLGPSPSFISRVRQNHRVQILIKIEPQKSHRNVRDSIRRTNKSLGNPPRNYRISIDVDPAGLT